MLERRVLENLTSAVLLFDRDLRLEYVNPGGEMLFAVSARHLLGLRITDLIQCDVADKESTLEMAFASRHPITEREMRIRFPDGRTITVDCTVVPIPGHGDRGEILVELQQLDRQLRISREEQLLSQQQEARALVRGLAHEIKNPLGGLRGAAQLLERELPDAALREYTRIIIEEADRLQNLVNRMLGPNRVPRKGEVNVHRVLERVRSLIQAETGDAIVIHRDFDPSIPSLWGDSDQLIQALLNIVGNAAQALGNRGNITLRTRVLRHFTIGSHRHRLVVKIDVIDNGPGVPPEMLERIFFPMVSGGTGGMGLGLSIAQTLINQHSGLIECQSRPGETTFTVLLPLEGPNDST